MAKDKKSTPQEIEPVSLDQFTEKFGEVLAGWDFSEFIKHDRGRIWYIVFSIIVLGLLIYSYFVRNPLFAVIIVIALIIYIITERKEPDQVSIVLTEDGFLLNDKFINYEDLAAFYIIYYPPQIKNLYLQPKNSFKPVLTIPLEQQNPIIIRKILLQYLKEDLDKEEMPATESIAHSLKL